MDRKTIKQRTLKLVQLAILLAVTVVLQYIGNFIPLVTGINLTLIPLVVGAALLGPAGGTILGLTCGVMTLMTPMAQGIMNFSPVMALLICLGKTGLAGFAAGWIYRLLAKKNKHAGIAVASVAAPIINTGVFVCGCSLLLEHFRVSQDFGVLPAETTVAGFFGIICMAIAANFIVEFLINAIASTAIYQVINVVERQFKK